MQIALVVNSFPVLSQTFVFNKAIALRQRGLDITIHAQSFHGDKSFYIDRLDGLSLDFVRYSVTAQGLGRIPLRLGECIAQEPHIAINLYKRAVTLYGLGMQALRAWTAALPLAVGQYDLIHFEHSGLAVTYLDALPLLKPTKLVTSCIGTAELFVPIIDPRRVPQLKLLFPLLDGVHCVTEDIRRSLTSYGLQLHKSFINYPSIDVIKFTRSRPYPMKEGGPYRMVSVGRLNWIKGFEYGLSALQNLIEKGYDIIYTIIGNGVEEERLRFTIHKLDLAKHVHLRGGLAARDVKDELEFADIFLLPSLSEGISNAVLEAMAMEVPIVSTCVGGMPEAITDGREGFLVSPYQPNLMSNRIEVLLNNVELRQSMGRMGRERVTKHFSLERHINTFVHQYQMLIGGEGERS